jgi:hypothetical protein
MSDLPRRILQVEGHMVLLFFAIAAAVLTRSSITAWQRRRRVAPLAVETRKSLLRLAWSNSEERKR